MAREKIPKYRSLLANHSTHLYLSHPDIYCINVIFVYYAHLRLKLTLQLDISSDFWPLICIYRYRINVSIVWLHWTIIYQDCRDGSVRVTSSLFSWSLLFCLISKARIEGKSHGHPYPFNTHISRLSLK